MTVISKQSELFSIWVILDEKQPKWLQDQFSRSHFLQDKMFHWNSRRESCCRDMIISSNNWKQFGWWGKARENTEI